MFLNEFIKSPHIVSWKTKKCDKRSSNSGQRWYCNPLINSIFTNGANHAIFESINGEYTNNPIKPWRSKLQRLYLFLSQNMITAPLLSEYTIYISPHIKDSRNKLIIGGNTKIRMIDVTEGRVYVILKSGFATKYIEREIYARSNFKYLSIPKIYQIGNNANWYSEEYITGSSPNRLDSSNGREALKHVIVGIHKMLNDTKSIQSLSRYILELENRILTGIRHITFLDDEYRQKFIEFTKQLSKELIKSSDRNITTAYCHGDFHQGNIMCDGTKNWILDWENSGHKQIGYDLLILLVESRIPNGFFTRFSKLINNQFDSNQWELVNNWPNINWNNKESKEIMLLLFLLEELEFYVSENTNKLFFSNPKVLIDRYIELEMAEFK